MRFGLSDAELEALGGTPLRPDDPQRVGRFRLLGMLGSGGMGRVYLGRADGRLAAVKVIRAELADSVRFRQRFRHELQAVSRLGGGFTAGLIEADQDARQPWMATEYVPGLSVKEAVDRHGVLPVPAVWRMVGGVADALAAIHDVGIVHRDLKPSNVILALDGPKVIDFGVARAADLSRLTMTGQQVGTPAYMAPEQAKTGAVGAASDVFALAGMVVFAATGRPPFGEGSPTEVLFRVVHEPPDLSGLRALDADLHGLVERCLDKDPVRRPSAAAVAAAVTAQHPAPDWPETLRERIEPRTTAVATAWDTEPVVPADAPTSGGDEPDVPRWAPHPPPPQRRTRTLVAAGLAVLLTTLAAVTVGLLLTHRAYDAPSALTAHGSPPSTPRSTGPATSPTPSRPSPSGSPTATASTRKRRGGGGGAGGGTGGGTGAAPTTAQAAKPAPAPPVRVVTATAKPSSTAPAKRPWDSCDAYSGTELTEYGDNGRRVVEVQCILKARGYDLGPSGVDGDFGQRTLAAVKSFQTDHGLEVDGQVGKHTWAALRA